MGLAHRFPPTSLPNPSRNINHGAASGRNRMQSAPWISDAGVDISEELDVGRRVAALSCCRPCMAALRNDQMMESVSTLNCVDVRPLH